MSENDGSLSEVRALEAIGVVCEQCDWRYFAPGDGTIPDVSPSSVCPHCGSARLIPLDRDAADHLYSAPPELVVPLGSVRPSWPSRLPLSPLAFPMLHQI